MKIDKQIKINLEKKYFISYLYNNYQSKPLHIMVPKTRVYVEIYHGQTKWMYFLTEDDDLLEKCNTTWDKVSSDIKNNFMANLSAIKIFSKQKSNTTVMKLHTFTKKKS